MANYHIRHNFRSLVADDSDPTTVGPFQWNDEHGLAFDQAGVLASVDGVTVAVMSFGDLTNLVSSNVQPLINAAIATLFGNYDPTSVPMWAFKLSLAQGTYLPGTSTPTGNLLTKLIAALPAFQDDPIVVRWENQLFVAKGDTFYSWVQTTLSLTAVQMLAITAQGKTIASAG